MDFAQSAQQLAQGWTDALKGMTGVQLPADALPALQSTYLSEAAALWNQATQGADGTAPAADRRFAAKDWLSNPAAAFTAGMYMLNARTLLQLADQVQADEKTAVSASASRSSSGSTPRRRPTTWR